MEENSPGQISIVEGRHPVLEVTQTVGYVANSVNMHAQGPRCLVITGPNMGGKSSFIRQVALLTIMAQVIPIPLHTIRIPYHATPNRSEN